MNEISGADKKSGDSDGISELPLVKDSNLLLEDNKQPIFIQELIRFVSPPLINFIIVTCLIVTFFDIRGVDLSVNENALKDFASYEECILDEGQDNNEGTGTEGIQNKPGDQEDEEDVKIIESLPCVVRVPLDFMDKITTELTFFTEGTPFTEALEDISNVIGGAAFAGFVFIAVIIIISHEVVSFTGHLLHNFLKSKWSRLKFDRGEYVINNWDKYEIGFLIDGIEASHRPSLEEIKSGAKGKNIVETGVLHLIMASNNDERVSGTRSVREALERKVSFWGDLHAHALGIALFIVVVILASIGFFGIFNLKVVGISIILFVIFFVMRCQNRILFYKKEIMNYDRAVLHYLVEHNAPDFAKTSH